MVVLIRKVIMMIMIRIIMTRNGGFIEKSYIDDNDNDNDNTDKGKVVLIRIILTGEWSL